MINISYQLNDSGTVHTLIALLNGLDEERWQSQQNLKNSLFPKGMGI